MLKIELAFIFIYLLNRLSYTPFDNLIKDKSQIKLHILKRLLSGLIIAPFMQNLTAFGLVLFLYILIIISESWLYKIGKQTGIQYILQLFIGLIGGPLAACLLNSIMPSYTNPVCICLVSFLKSFPVLNFFIKPLNFNMVILILSGYLFCIKESTIIIRFILQKKKAVPLIDNKPGKQDTEEYNRGRLIGILERFLIFSMVIINNIAGIAIIIALKSLARFEKLKDKNFAEYFLIGSLLSLILAVLPGAAIRWIISMGFLK